MNGLMLINITIEFFSEGIKNVILVYLNPNTSHLVFNL